MESTDPLAVPTQRTWEASNINFSRWLLPWCAWIAVGWPAGIACADLRGWGCAALIVVFFAWSVLGLFAGVQTVRLFFRMRGAFRKLALASSLPVALLSQWALFSVTWGPSSDAGMIGDFYSNRATFETQAGPGEDLRIVRWSWTSPLITANNLSKGLLRTGTEPSPLVGSLDLAWLEWPRRIPAYRRIEGDWYLFLEDR